MSRTLARKFWFDLALALCGLLVVLAGWLAGEDGEQVRQRAAKAYNTYQHCGLRAAQNLFATGW